MHITDELTLLRTNKMCLLQELRFLKLCKNNKVFPKFITKSTITYNNYHMKKRVHQNQLALLRSAIKHTRSNLAFTEKRLYRVHNVCLKTFATLIWDHVDRVSWAIAHGKATLKKSILKKKLRKLTQDKPRECKKPIPFPPNPAPNCTNVINLSTVTLSPVQIEALDLGQNFSHFTPKSILLDDLIPSLNFSLSRNLPTERALEAKLNVVNLISRHEDVFVNNDPLHSIKNLINNNDIFIMKADKGNKTVVIDQSTYDSNMNKILNDPLKYIEIQKTPINQMVKNLKTTLKSCTSLAPDDMKKLDPPKHNLPHIYALPKIHKDPISFRPIVSKSDSLFHPVAKYVSSKIKHLQNFNKFSVKNSNEVIHKLNNFKLEDNDILISFDVTALYPSVPADEAIAILEASLYSHSNGFNSENKDLITLTELCTSNSYFKFKDRFFNQISGLAMGCPLSSTLADLYMDQIDNTIMNNTLRPKLWIRYVDDILAIWPHGPEKLKEFLIFINSLNPHIKFTFELEVNHKLPFLDILIERTKDNKFNTTVYRKPNAISNPPHFKSNHPTSQKLSAFTGFVTRAVRLCSNDSLLNEEIDTLYQLATSRGYSHTIIDNALRKVLNKKSITDVTTLQPLKSEEQKYVLIPYTPKLGDKICKVLKKYKIKSVFKPMNKTSLHCNNFKTKIKKTDKSGIYSIPCKDCNGVYIGQTKRNFNVRLKEHIADTGYNINSNRYLKAKLKPEKSAVAKHRFDTNHKINWTEAKIIKECPNYLLNSHESFQIMKNPNNFNRKEDNNFPHIWKSTVVNC